MGDYDALKREYGVASNLQHRWSKSGHIPVIHRIYGLDQRRHMQQTSSLRPCRRRNFNPSRHGLFLGLGISSHHSLREFVLQLALIHPHAFIPIGLSFAISCAFRYFAPVSPVYVLCAVCGLVHQPYSQVWLFKPEVEPGANLEDEEYMTGMHHNCTNEANSQPTL